MQPELLGSRMLLSGNSFAIQAKGSSGPEVIALHVSSTYVNESANSIDVTITRSLGSALVDFKSPLTLELTAQALAQATKRGGTPEVSHIVAPVHESVTIPAGTDSATVSLPVSATTSLPAVVPVQVTASPVAGSKQKATIEVDLANSPQSVPPSIVRAQVVRSGSVGRGIAVTFSQAMSPASVEDIHNYVVKEVPLSQVTLSSVAGLSVLQPTAVTNPAAKALTLKAARYDAATNTVLLIPAHPLTVAKSFIVKSPATLGTRGHGSKWPKPLTDANGNVLNPLSSPAGAFSITISPKG